MTRTLLGALAAAAIALTCFAAQADEFSLDLTKVDPATASGQAAIQAFKTAAADAYCGPVHMPQPIDLAGQRAACQRAVKADAQAQIDRVLAKRQAAREVQVLASR